MSFNKLDSLMLQADIANQEAREGGSMSNLKNKWKSIRFGDSIDGGLLEDTLRSFRERGYEDFYLCVNQEAYWDDKDYKDPYLELFYRKEKA